MTIRLQPKPVQTPKPKTNFTKEQIEDLFSQTENWYEFYNKNIDKFRKAEIYNWCVFPLLKMEGKFHKCVLHPTVDVDAGNKVYTHFWKNIHFSEFVSHCIFYKPEEHKKYIIEKLLND